ncbi:MAG: hypothetical protein ACJ8DV_21640, partial [Microvirga sp.]
RDRLAQHSFLAQECGKLGGLRTALLQLGRVNGSGEGGQGDGLESRDGAGGVLFARSEITV